MPPVFIFVAILVAIASCTSGDQAPSRLDLIIYALGGSVVLAIILSYLAWLTASLTAPFIGRTGILSYLSKASPMTAFAALAVVHTIAILPAVPLWLDTVVGWELDIQDTPAGLIEATFEIGARYTAFNTGIFGLIMTARGLFALRDLRPGHDPELNPDETVSDAAQNLLAGLTAFYIAAAFHHMTATHQIPPVS